MSLSSEVQARWGAQFLINLSNPYLPNATTLDSTRLSNACTDVEAEIKIYCGVTFDATNAMHLSVAMDGVILKLQLRAGTISMSEAQKQWEDRLKALAKVTGRNRVLPTTDSILEPTSEANEDGSAVRPDFDRNRFNYYRPGEPGAPNYQPPD